LRCARLEIERPDAVTQTPRGCFPRDVFVSILYRRSVRGPKILLALRQRGQLLVGCPFLIEGLPQTLAQSGETSKWNIGTRENGGTAEAKTRIS
jgi:hypothetical protein